MCIAALPTLILQKKQNITGSQSVPFPDPPLTLYYLCLHIPWVQEGTDPAEGTEHNRVTVSPIPRPSTIYTLGSGRGSSTTPMRYLLATSLASVEWPTSSNALVASNPAQIKGKTHKFQVLIFLFSEHIWEWPGNEAISLHPSTIL